MLDPVGLHLRRHFSHGIGIPPYRDSEHLRNRVQMADNVCICCYCFCGRHDRDFYVLAVAAATSPSNAKVIVCIIDLRTQCS